MTSVRVLAALVIVSVLMASPSAAAGASALSDTQSASAAQYAPPPGPDIPFTGYGVFPTLLLGVGTLVAGLVLRRTFLRRSAD